MRAEFVDQPDLPLAVAKADQVLAHELARTGGQSGSGISEESRNGAQYRRSNLPINVPGPMRLSCSFCSRDIMATLPRCFAMFLQLLGAIIGSRVGDGSQPPCPYRASPLQREIPPGSGRRSHSRQRSKRAVHSVCRPLLVGDPGTVEMHAHAAGLSPNLQVVRKPSGSRWSDGTVSLLEVRDGGSAPLKIGTIDAAYGRASLASASRAIQAALAGDIEAVVAAPQTERSIAAAGIAFDGYPSFVAQETGTPVNDVYLMICFDQSRIVHTTLHVSVREAVALITPERVERVIRVADTSLKKLGVPNPKIFVSGLNPHAGEDGLFGSEEIDIIIPAIARANKTGIDVSGPFGADTMFEKKGVMLSS